VDSGDVHRIGTGESDLVAVSWRCLFIEGVEGDCAAGAVRIGAANNNGPDQKEDHCRWENGIFLDLRACVCVRVRLCVCVCVCVRVCVRASERVM
jgi:hypothetical protein